METDSADNEDGVLDGVVRWIAARLKPEDEWVSGGIDAAAWFDVRARACSIL